MLASYQPIYLSVDCEKQILEEDLRMNAESEKSGVGFGVGWPAKKVRVVDSIAFHEKSGYSPNLETALSAGMISCDSVGIGKGARDPQGCDDQPTSPLHAREGRGLRLIPNLRSRPCVCMRG